MQIGLIKIMCFMLLVACFSCKTPSVISTKEVATQTDSSIKTNTKQSVYDSVYSKPASSQIIKITVDTSAKLPNVKQVVSTGGDSLTLEIKGNEITAKSNCDAIINRYRREALSKDSTIKAMKFKQQSEVTHETIVKERVVPPWWLKPLLIIMSVVILALVGYIAFKEIWM